MLCKPLWLRKKALAQRNGPQGDMLTWKHSYLGPWGNFGTSPLLRCFSISSRKEVARRHKSLNP